MNDLEKVDFGFEKVLSKEKNQLVKNIFDRVSSKYDIMNDVMSFGLHRIWKMFTIFIANPQIEDKILDIAGGTGDLSLGFKKAQNNCEIWHTDINFSMLKNGQTKLLDKGIDIPNSVCNAEFLPFKDNYFNIVCVSFGLRNMTNKDGALKEMFRVLTSGGALYILEFSKVYSFLNPLYNFYLFKIIPLLGKVIAKDKNSYEYLAQSIKMHPSQDELCKIIYNSGFFKVEYYNLLFGVATLHKAIKIT